MKRKEVRMKNKIKKTMSLAVIFLMTILLTIPVFGEPLKGSITIHKYSSDSLPMNPGTGLESDISNIPTGALPLEGIEFTLYRIDSSITPGSLNPSEITPGSNEIDTSFTPITDTTNSVGEIEFPDLEDGIYFIIETNSKAADGKDYTPAIPFLVSMPMTNPNGDGILRDVHVFPKNQLQNPSKTTTEGNPNAAQPGDTIEWIIYAPIPFNMEKISAYKITDKVDSELLIIDEDSVKVYTTPNKTPGTGTPVIGDDSIYTTSLVDGLLTVEFTPAGIAYLIEQQIDGHAFVRVEFNSEMTDKAAGMSVENGASLVFEDDQGTHTREIPDPEKPYIFSGIIGIQKMEKDPNGGADIPLDGAKFKVALTEQDARDKNFIKMQNGEDLIAETGVTYSQGRSGYAELRGIPFGEDGEVPTAGTTENIEFWLVEVQAPAGYKLNKNPIRVPYTYVKTTDNDIDLHYINQSVGIYNSKGFTLPQTGGAGIIISTVVGLGLLGLVIFVVGQRKKAKK